MSKYIVYMHTVPNGKVYIGITSKTPNQRWRNGKGYISNTYFYKAILKYGWENIKHEIIYEGLDEETANKEERGLIALYRSNNYRYGYNFTSGGLQNTEFTVRSKKRMSDGLKGHPVSEEARRKMRENHCRCDGKYNSNYGRKWTKEEIAIRQEHRKYATGGDHAGARPILQYDLNGNLVKRWSCIKDASQEYCRTSIKDCLKGKYKQHRGYIWRYE